MTTTTAPATFAQVINTYTDALLADLFAGSDTCACCGDPSWASVLNTPSPTAWVDVDLRTVHVPHDWTHVMTFLAHAPMTEIADGRFRVSCHSRARAITVARCLRIVGAPAGAITIGGDSK